MSEELGLRTYGEKEEMIFLGKEIHEQRDYSEKVAEKIDEEISRFLKAASDKAIELIRSKRDLLDKVAEALLEKETLEKDEFAALLAEAGNAS